MTKLYLHIGTPKSGTSSIQDFLRAHDAALPVRPIAALGGLNATPLLSVPGRADAVSPAILARMPLAYRLPPGVSRPDPQAVADEIAATQPGVETFVASEEAFYTVFDRDIAAIDALAEWLHQVFDEVVILIYLRDNAAYVRSMYSQLAKRGRITESFKSYVSNPMRLRDLCDYATRVDLWAQAFGRENTYVVPVAPENLHGGTLITDFLHRIGVADTGLHTAARNFRPKNVSPTALQLDLVRWATKIGLHRKLRRRWLNNRNTRKLSSKGLTYEYDDAIRAVAALGNAYLNRHYLSEYQVKLPE